MIVLLVVGIIAIIASIYVARTHPGGPAGDPRIQTGGKIALFAGIAIIIISIAGGSIATVPAGHRGVVIRFSAVTGTILEEGLRTKLPFVDSVVIMDVRTDKYEVAAAAASRDLQSVSTTIALNWRLDPGSTSQIYRTLGMEYIGRIAAPAVQEVIKQVVARHRAEELITNREIVRNQIAEELAVRLLERGIITEAVSITEFRFNETFVAAIEAKVAAEQSVLEAQFRLEEVRVEAQQREAEAEGEANARIAAANGEAEFIRIVTDAQVAANAAIAPTLSAEILQYIFLDRLGSDIKVIVVPSGQSLDLVLPEAGA